MARVPAFTKNQVFQLVEGSRQRDADFRDQCAVQRHYLRTGRLLKSLKGRDLTKTLAGDEWLRALETPNFALSDINTVIATATAQLPSFTVEPGFLTPVSQVEADATHALITTFMERDEVLSKVRIAAADKHTLGGGMLQVGWLLEEDELGDEEHAAAVDSAVESYREESRELGLDPDDPDELAAQEQVRSQVPRSRVVSSRPTCTVVEPFDCHFPPNITDIKLTPWYAVSRRERVDEVRANEAYDAEAREKVGSNTDEDSDARRTDDEAGSAPVPDEAATIVHFWDVRAHRYMVFDAATKAVLADTENPNEFKDVTLVHMRGFRDGSRLRGFSDLENAIGSYEKLARVDRMQLDNLSNQGNVFVTRSDMLTDEEKKKLAMAKPGDVIPLSEVPMQTPLNEVIVPLPQMALTADTYQARSQYRQDAADTMNLNEYQLGSVGPDRGNATQAAVADGQTTIKARDAVETVERAFTEVANLFLLYCRQYLDEAVVVSMVGPGGSTWDEQRTVSRDDIAGDYRLRVKQGSLSAVNPATKRSHGMETITLVQTLAATGLLEVEGLQKMLSMGLRDAGYDPDLIGLKFKPQQPVATAPAPANPSAGDPAAMPPMPGASGGDALPPELMAALAGGMGDPMGAPPMDPSMGPMLPPMAPPVDPMMQAPQDAMMDLGGPPVSLDGGMAF